MTENANWTHEKEYSWTKLKNRRGWKEVIERTTIYSYSKNNKDWRKEEKKRLRGTEDLHEINANPDWRITERKWTKRTTKMICKD